MDFSPRKGGARRATRNLQGRPRGKLIRSPRRPPSPTLDDIYSDDDRGRGASPYIHAAVDDNDGSDTSRFSDVDDANSNAARKREQEREREREKRRRADEKECKRRQQTMDELAEAQRRGEMQRDRAADCVDMVNDDDESVAASFDGICIDRIRSPAKRTYVDGVMQQLGGGRDGAGRPGEKKTHRRGARHARSSLAQRALREEEGSVQRFPARDRRQKSYARKDVDPLDLAREQQRAARRSPKTALRQHGDLPEEDKSRLKRRGRGTQQTVTQAVGGAMKMWGNASMTARRGKRTTAPRREEQARAALLRETARGSSEGPSSGEKRGPAREDGAGSRRKKQAGPKGAPRDAIDLDSSLIASDSSARSGESPPQHDDGAQLVEAIQESLQSVGQEEYKHLETPTPRRKSLWDGEKAKSALKGLQPFGLRPAGASSVSNSRRNQGKKSVVDHLTPKAKDDIVSSPDAAPCDASVGRYGRIPRKAATDRAFADSDWLSRIPEGTTQRAAARGGSKDRRTSHARKQSTGAKLKKQGGLFNESRTGSIPKKQGDTFEERGVKPSKQKSGNSSRLRSDNAGRRKTRSSPRTRKGPKSTDGSSHDVITIDSSSDEDDASSVSEEHVEKNVAEGSATRKRTVGDRASIDAVRIAVGKKVFNKKCELSFQFGTHDPYIQFSYFHKDKQIQHPVYLKHDELKEVKYFVAGDDDSSADDSFEPMTVIVFRITPTMKNKFDKYSNAYSQEDTEDEEKTQRRFISVEVRDAEDFQRMLHQMREHEILEAFCNKGAEIPLRDLAKYTIALQEENRKERELRQSVGRRTRSGGRTKRKEGENKLLLVYPFDVDEAILTRAAAGLKELGGDSLGVQTPHDSGEQPTLAASLDQDDKGDITNSKGSSRTHYITIRQDDKERLCPGEFLNDSLVDFWMRWISRGESQKRDSDVHFFTSHFMTTLKNEGTQAVSSWTANKKINVFKKRLIFVPVNADLHWSLCVVVNPGLIANNYDRIAKEHDEDLQDSEEYSFILFLDSLKMHSKATYARHIRTWLNFEWERLGKGEVDGEVQPYDKKTMILRSPKIPYQENGCDCGVFVCRYAYALFVMRHEKFTWEDGLKKFPTLITRGSAFQFGMADIARIRKELGTLIDRLSIQYLKMKEQEKAEKRAKRKEAKRSKTDKKDASSEIVGEESSSGREDENNSRAARDISDKNCGAADEDMTGAVVGVRADRNVPPSEEKENIPKSQDSTDGKSENSNKEKESISPPSEQPKTITSHTL